MKIVIGAGHGHCRGEIEMEYCEKAFSRKQAADPAMESACGRKSFEIIGFQCRSCEAKIGLNWIYENIMPHEELAAAILLANAQKP